MKREDAETIRKVFIKHGEHGGRGESYFFIMKRGVDWIMKRKDAETLRKVFIKYGGHGGRGESYFL